jgi:hypothetical protein
MKGKGWTPRDLRAVADTIVDVLEERGLVAGSAGPSRVLEAAKVAWLLGRDRQWVYDHASELGAFRLGEESRARIGFEQLGRCVDFHEARATMPPDVVKGLPRWGPAA